jgi:hypothetical protein
MEQLLTLFISSKMQELAQERLAIQEALKDFHLYGWLWETDAGARPEPIHSVYLKEVAASDIYIGLFWLGYGPYTIEEFEHARHLHKPCLIYEKHIDIDQRSPQLAAFLGQLEQVKNPDGLTICRFATTEQLAAHVQRDVMRLLTTVYHETRRQPTDRPQSSNSRAANVSAEDHSIAIGRDSYGPITQNNYGRSIKRAKRKRKDGPE